MKGTTKEGNTGNIGNNYKASTGTTASSNNHKASASTNSNTVKIVLVGNTTPSTNPKGKTLRTALANIFSGGNQGDQHSRVVKRSIGGRSIDISLQDIDQQETQTTKLQNYTDTDTFLLTFGFGSRPSFESIKTWCSEAKRSAPNATLVLLGVKEKAGEKEVVSTQDAQQLAKELHINNFAECSLDNPQSIQKAFDKAIELGSHNH
jgi:GTPase SAR1 family protein